MNAALHRVELWDTVSLANMADAFGDGLFSVFDDEQQNATSKKILPTVAPETGYGHWALLPFRTLWRRTIDTQLKPKPNLMCAHYFATHIAFDCNSVLLTYKDILAIIIMIIIDAY